MVQSCVILAWPPESRNVQTNRPTAPGNGNSITALPGSAAAIRHSTRPELLLWVTPLDPAANGPKSSIETTSASNAQLLTVVQKTPRKFGGYVAFDRMLKLPGGFVLVHFRIMAQSRRCAPEHSALVVLASPVPA